MGVVRTVALAHRKLRSARAVGDRRISAAGVVRLQPYRFGTTHRATNRSPQQSPRTDRWRSQIQPRAVSELEGTIRSRELEMSCSLSRAGSLSSDYTVNVLMSNSCSFAR